MQTEEDLQHSLAAEAVKGPRSYRGRLLAELTPGLRDLCDKVISPSDTPRFYDFLLLHILAEAWVAPQKTEAETRALRVACRTQLLIATDNLFTFRGEMSVRFDELSDAEQAEAKRLADELLGVIATAEVKIAEKKSAVEPPAASSQTTTPSTSRKSPKKPAGSPSTSAGS